MRKTTIKGRTERSDSFACQREGGLRVSETQLAVPTHGSQRHSMRAVDRERQYPASFRLGLRLMPDTRKAEAGTGSLESTKSCASPARVVSTVSLGTGWHTSEAERISLHREHNSIRGSGSRN